MNHKLCFQRPFARKVTNLPLQELRDLVTKFSLFQTFKLKCPRCQAEIDLSKETVTEHRCHRKINGLRPTYSQSKILTVIVLIGREDEVRVAAQLLTGQRLLLVFV